MNNSTKQYISHTLQMMQQYKISIYLFCIFLILIIIIPNDSYADTEVVCKSSPDQNINVRYRLFDAKNLWSKILLDTRTGKAWVVFYSVDANAARVRVQLNNDLIPDTKNARDGRFTIYATGNMWTFILLDQDMGYVWQLNYSMVSEGFKGIIPIQDGSWK